MNCKDERENISYQIDGLAWRYYQLLGCRTRIGNSLNTFVSEGLWSSVVSFTPLLVSGKSGYLGHLGQ
jgi:hypothetical protein